MTANTETNGMPHGLSSFKEDHILMRDMAIKRIKDKITELQVELETQVNDRVDTIVKKIITELEQKDVLTNEIRNLFGSEKYDTLDKKKTSNGCLPEKQFTARNSLLTDLFEIKHIKTIYHMFLAIMLGLCINTTAYDYLQKQRIRFGFHLILAGFGKIHVVLLTWVSMFLLSLVVYICFSYWAQIRVHLYPKSMNLRMWDVIWLSLLLIYCFSFVYYCTMIVIDNALPIPSASIVLMEMARLLMKTYAFVRSNAPRALKYKQHIETDVTSCPAFSKYLYFLFAPTLVYKDSYPRTKEIRWRFVFFHFLEVAGVIVYLSFIVERYLISAYENFGLIKYTWNYIVLSVLGNSLAGILFLLSGFYCLLHAWMNAFSEMLTFADRMFYKDWWTCTSFDAYYRTWNVVVHDWLYTYIYKDMYEVILPKHKTMAKFMVFFISAVVHEYIIGFMMGFCFPLLFVLFIFGGLAVSFVRFGNNAFGNIFLWYSLALGTSIAISGYCIEFYARLNYPKDNPTIIDYFVPRALACMLK